MVWKRKLRGVLAIFIYFPLLLSRFTSTLLRWLYFSNWFFFVSSFCSGCSRFGYCLELSTNWCNRSRPIRYTALILVFTFRVGLFAVFGRSIPIKKTSRERWVKWTTHISVIPTQTTSNRPLLFRLVLFMIAQLCVYASGEIWMRTPRLKSTSRVESLLSVLGFSLLGLRIAIILFRLCVKHLGYTSLSFRCRFSGSNSSTN